MRTVGLHSVRIGIAYRRRMCLSIGVVLLSTTIFPQAATAEQSVADVSFFDEALAVSKQLDPDVDIAACKAAFKTMVETIKSSLEAAKAEKKSDLTPAEIVAVFNREILVRREVSYISNKYWRDSLFTSALTKNRGNCASTALLYYLVAQKLQLPIYLAFAPEHAFARWDDGKTTINIETTDKGVAHSDQELMEYFGLSAEDLKPNCFLVTPTEKQIRASIRALWSNVFFSMEKRDEARQFLAKARELDPQSPRLALVEAQSLLFEGNAEKARGLLDGITKTASGPWATGSAKLALVGFLQSRGQFEEAAAILNGGYAASRGEIKIHMAHLLGAYYRQKRDFDKAIPLYQFIVITKQDEISFTSLGGVFAEARRDKEALACFDQAAALNPESFFIQIERAVIYNRMGEKDKSRDIVAKLEEPRDSKLSWHHCMAFYFANVNDEPKLLAHMTDAFKIDKSGATYQYFVREQDMDSYREHAEFKKLMEANKPAAK